MPDTRFRIGSMNKMYTAVATVQLVEAGKLALDDTVDKHLPDYPNRDVASKVTVRHLLTHTGGTGDICGPEFERNRLSVREHSDYVNLYGSRGLSYEPGTRNEYSNLAMSCRRAHRSSKWCLLLRLRARQRVRPGRHDFHGLAIGIRGRPEPAVEYMGSGDAWAPNADTLPWRGTAAGGGHSTVGDLMRFARALGSES